MISSQFFVVQFWWGWVNCSLSFLFLTNRCGTRVLFRCCSPSRSRFSILCFQRWLSTYLDCNLYLFKLPLPSYKLKAVWLFFSGSNNFCPEDCLVETPEMVVLENSRRSVSEILRAAACLSGFKVNSVTFHPHSDSQFESEQVILTMSTFLTHWVTATWLADLIVVLASSWTGVLNEVGSGQTCKCDE